jgi:hypothetical protein
MRIILLASQATMVLLETLQIIGTLEVTDHWQIIAQHLVDEV